MGRGKALLIYNEASGMGGVLRHIDTVVSRLSKVFDAFDVRKTDTMEQGMAWAEEACGVYEALIFAGGDGTFNHIISALVGKKDAPTIGYINGGTISDIGKNFGIRGSLNRALSIIERGATCGFDVGKVNGRYFTYVAAVGAFADIAYVTKRKYKKRLGRVAYYFKAVEEALTPKRIPCVIDADGQHYELKVPFILCMSGKNVGGFRVNSKKSDIHDGKFELYLTRPGLFNGLIHYLFFKMRTVKIVASKIDIRVDYPLPWCLDGEPGPSGNVSIEAMDSGLRIFCAEKFADGLQ